MSNNLSIWTANLPGYKLLDSGNKQKLEEVAGIRMVRSEPRAWWQPSIDKSEWNKAVATYEHESKGKWVFKGSVSEPTLETRGLKLKLKFPPTSKHFGVFPEQSSQWDFIEEKVKGAGREVKVLNLFGYTGISSLIAAKAGAQVTHVDGSRAVIGWARENQEASGLEGAPIRWILDDVVDFVKREVKRGNKYDGIIMDPPSFGRGPKGQVWKIEDELVGLLKLCREVMSEKPLFFILNMYSTELSALTLKNLLLEQFPGGNVEAGELVIAEEGSGRPLPLSIFANYGSK